VRSKRSKAAGSAPSSKAIHRVDAYAADVLSGTVVAGPYVRLACKRHVEDRQREGTPGWPYRFSADHADYAIAFFETVLRLPDMVDEDGVPVPFLLKPWQAFVIGSLFGWVNERGKRRFREAYLEIGKGNGKTPMAAGVGLLGLMADGERAAEIYAAAAAQEQAAILFKDAVRIVDATPDLVGTPESPGPITRSGGEHVWELKHAASLSTFKMLSRESGSRSGQRPHMGLLDELHEHPNGETSVKVRAGAKRREQPLFFEITNSGFDRTSVCWHHHEHSRKVVEGTIDDPHWFAYVCALDEGDDPLVDESCWVKANPNLGVSIQQEYLRRQVQTAVHMPSEANMVLRLNFCVWTQAESRYFNQARWQACGASVPEGELDGALCYAALDAGQTDDLSAFARTWWLNDGRVAVAMRYWIPRAALEKHPHRPYAMWERAGLLTVTDGEVADYERIEQDVYDLCRESGVLECGYDKRFLGQMAQRLTGAGLTMVDVPQGFFLNEALRKLNTLVVDGDLCHGGDPVLSWMADNAVVRFGRNQEIRLDKDQSKDKIDGIAALTMAVQLGIVQENGPSVYDTRGALVL
jgi:phage terminase large subunit-like protein